MTSLFVRIFFALLLFDPTSAIPSQCAIPTPETGYRDFDVIFTGHVLKIEPVRFLWWDKKNDFGERKVVVTFFACGKWKGISEDTVRLHTIENKTSRYGYTFKEGGIYLVYALRGKDGTLGVTHCSVKESLNAIDDLRRLQSETQLLPPGLPWGQVKQGIQLSLVAFPKQVHFPGEVRLHLAARNTTMKPIPFDAVLPAKNDGSLVITDPEGNKIGGINAYDDQRHPFLIQPGDTDYGLHLDTTLGVTEWSSHWFPKTQSLKGTYKIVWRLRDVESNVAQIEFR